MSVNSASETLNASDTDEACCCESMHLKILEKLAESTTSLKAKEISRSLGMTKSSINQVLYELNRRGVITQTLHGSCPRWSYNRECNYINQQENRTFDLLLQKREPMSCHSIAWNLQESKHAINRILYNLEKDGKVERLQLSPPIWKARRKLLSSETKPGKGDTTGDKNVSGDTKKRKYIALEHYRQDGKKELRNQASSQSVLHEIQTGQREKNKMAYKKHDEGLVDQNLSDKIALAVWNKYRELVPDSKIGEVMIAGYVLRKQHEGAKDKFEVIAFGTGTKCVAGDKLSLEGKVVHDCHAEIIARRSLLRWLYQQLLNADKANSFASKSPAYAEHPYSLRPLELWLYCSQAPCGDAAVFSRDDPHPGNKPCFSTRNHGRFRTKIEAGNGGILTSATRVQTFDGMKLGDRALHHCCSDKLAKRCFLGVQGSLLSQLIPPVYITGIVISDVFAFSHIARALCCRSELALGGNFSDSDFRTAPSSFELHHPRIGKFSLHTSRNKQVLKQITKLSMNWALGDGNDVETLDATIGSCENGGTSRISKKAFFSMFCKLQHPSTSLTYGDHKRNSIDYQGAKNMWKNAMRKRFGNDNSWISKPSEVDDFLM